MDAPNLNINVENDTLSLVETITGINFIEGPTKRGPVAYPNDIIYNWPQWERLFGGLITSSNFPLLAKRILDRGVPIRTNRVAHYTDVADDTTLTADKSALAGVEVLTFDADLVTANTFDVDLNGVAMASLDPIDDPFVDSNTSMDLIATALQGDAAVADAWVVDTGGASNRVIMAIPANNTALAFTNGTITNGASQPVCAHSEKVGLVDDDGNLLLVLAPKYEGLNYNNLIVTVAAASNGDANYFDLTITHTQESDLTETYKNQVIGTGVDVANSTWLDIIINLSALMDFTYQDLSSLGDDLRPRNAVHYLLGGDDGDTIEATDYSGDAAGGTGYHAFNNYDDALQIAAPEQYAAAIHTAGETYAAARKDLMYFAHIDNSKKTAANIITEKDLYSMSSEYASIWGGGLKISHPTTGVVTEISELADILANCSNTDFNYDPWFSIWGPKRGVIPNVLGVVNNFGSPANYGNLNQLANRNINMVITRNSKTMAWGEATARLTADQQQFINIQRMLIWLKKQLKPTVEEFLSDPIDPITWLAIYTAVWPSIKD